MKRLLLIASLATLPFLQLAEGQSQQGVPRSFVDLENFTAAAPNNTTNAPFGSAAKGHRLYGMRGYRITVCGTSTNTLAGAGTVDIYYWSASTQNNATWSFNKQLQETISVTGTSCGGSACICQTFGDHVVPTAVDGWIYPVANGITASAGTQVNIYTETWSTN